MKIDALEFQSLALKVTFLHFGWSFVYCVDWSLTHLFVKICNLRSNNVKPQKCTVLSTLEKDLKHGVRKKKEEESV